MNKSIIPIFVGFDPREAIAYHVCVQSILDTASRPVAIIPLHKPLLNGFDGQRDGSNAFTFSRYLVPALCNYQGWAIFMDGDMTVSRDIAELWEQQHVFYDKAVAVVKHEYSTKHPRKYLGTAMEAANADYPRKNWSSVILWNCGHFANRGLSAEAIAAKTPAELHRFSWLSDSLIAGLPHEWNVLVGEDELCASALQHFTLGVPGIRHYAQCRHSRGWHLELLRALQCADEEPVEMITRTKEIISAIQQLP